MALTTLDPNTALIIVDLQKGIVGLPGYHSIDGVICRARALADAFRSRGLPVVLVNVAGGAPGRTEQPRQPGTRPDGWTDFIPELDQQPTDIVVTKHSWGAFATTDLEAQLKGARRHPGRDRRRGDRNRRRGDGASGLRAGIQRHPRHRRHDRQASRGP